MNARAVLAAGVALAVAAVMAGVVLLSGGDSGESSDRREAPRRVVRAALTLERLVQPGMRDPELLVSLQDSQLNRLEVNGGNPAAVLQCFEAGGRSAFRVPVQWPLVEEPGFQPHIHQPAGRQLLDRIRRCRVTGPGIEFEGRVTGQVPAATP